MAVSSGSDSTLIKSEIGTPDGVWRDEHDRLPLKQRLKMLLASNRLSDFCDVKLEKESKSASTKDDPNHHSQGFYHGCLTPEGMNEMLLSEQSNAGVLGECIGGGTQASFCSDWNMHSEVNMDTVRVKEVDAGAAILLQCSVPLKCPVRVKAENPDNNITIPSGKDVMGHTDIPDDFEDYLDHIVLKERRRLLLSRESSEITKPVSEGNSPQLSNPVLEDMIQQSCGKVKEDSHSGDGKSSIGGNCTHDILERNSSYFWETLECGSLNGIIEGSSNADNLCAGMTGSGQETESIKSGNYEDERMCSSREASTIHRPFGGHDLVSNNQNRMHTTASTNVINVKVEPLDSHDLHSPGKNALGNFPFSKIVSVKKELETPDNSVGDEIDHMLLEDRINMMASRKVPNLDNSGNFKCSGKILPSALEHNPTASESTKPNKISRPRKRRKTATDSTEIALEEDVPELLQVLIEKGISINEIKLYGDMESDEALDDSFSEDSFAELEDVVSKLFSQRESLLKFAPMRCKKGEKASYCLACLLSLVEQARYLQFRKWPVEWGWCRDLQSFIFVFERHNRIVLERPEYRYATYFFELNDSVPINWQIKRLVTAMKVTNHSRITLIENKALMVGEDLTEGEARVLMEYGWIPNTGLGTMLNYCDRVVHDRKNESDSSEWRSKIGKLLMNGFNGGTIVSTEIPKKAMEYSGSESPLIKLEL